MQTQTPCGYIMLFFMNCRKVGMANGVHCLQIQIAMRGLLYKSNIR